MKVVPAWKRSVLVALSFGMFFLGGYIMFDDDTSVPLVMLGCMFWIFALWLAVVGCIGTEKQISKVLLGIDKGFSGGI